MIPFCSMHERNVLVRLCDLVPVDWNITLCRSISFSSWIIVIKARFTDTVQWIQQLRIDSSDNTFSFTDLRYWLTTVVIYQTFTSLLNPTHKVQTFGESTNLAQNKRQNPAQKSCQDLALCWGYALGSSFRSVASDTNAQESGKNEDYERERERETERERERGRRHLTHSRRGSPEVVMLTSADKFLFLSAPLCKRSCLPAWMSRAWGNKEAKAQPNRGVLESKCMLFLRFFCCEKDWALVQPDHSNKNIKTKTKFPSPLKSVSSLWMYL